MTTRDALMRFLKELTRSRGNDPNAGILAGLVDAMSREPSWRKPSASACSQAGDEWCST